MQWSVHAPNAYICAHRSLLLPAWSRPVASVLVILQPYRQADCEDMLHRTARTERQKQQLRQQFLNFSYPVAAMLQEQGHLAEVFDPRTGWPLLSPAGQLPLDDVAVVRSCLNYPTVCRHGCSVVLHPVWGSSVYPATLLSSASVADCTQLVTQRFGSDSKIEVAAIEPIARTGSRH